MKNIELIKLSNVHISVEGDYYEISFENAEGENEPYYLVQCDFEDPDVRCYIESDRLHLIGHYDVNQVTISNGTFLIQYGMNNKHNVAINYSATKSQQSYLEKVAKTMFYNRVLIGYKC